MSRSRMVGDGSLARRGGTCRPDYRPESVGVFQLLCVYYGLLILSRPVIVWKIVAVVTNFWSVAVYFRFARREENH
jgi:hypothetical protein